MSHNQNPGRSARNSCGRLLNSLHGSGSTILIPGFDYDSFEATQNRLWTSTMQELGPRRRKDSWSEVPNARGLGRHLADRQIGRSAALEFAQLPERLPFRFQGFATLRVGLFYPQTQCIENDRLVQPKFVAKVHLASAGRKPGKLQRPAEVQRGL